MGNASSVNKSSDSDFNEDEKYVSSQISKNKP